MLSEEEIKPWLRSQIDSSIKTESIYTDVFYLCYNNSYLRALKMSKITGKPVNKDDFKGGELLFGFNTKYKNFWHYFIIEDYLEENYSNDCFEKANILEEVFNEYDQYKGYEPY